MHDILIAIVLGIVEGLTEFIPVSSTGHLIVAGHALDYTGDKADTFEVFIQLGAILAVAVIYRERIRSVLSFAPGEGVQGRNGLFLLAVTSAPAFVLGAALHSVIKDHLFSPFTVAIGWGIGGIALILVEKYLPRVTKHGMDAIRVPDALIIGIAQCLALWPGVSRSAATISASMVRGIDRKAAAEYSFLIALPVIGAASLFDLYSNRDLLSSSDIPMFATGFVVSFIAAWFAVRFFLRLLAVTTMKPFGWYRIAASIILLVLIAADVINK